MGRAPEIRFPIELHRFLQETCSRGPLGGLALKVMVSGTRLDDRPSDIIVVKEQDGYPVLILEAKTHAAKT